MAEADPPAPPEVVQLAVQPASRLWVAALVGLGVAVLVGVALLMLGEVLLSIRPKLLDALITAGFP